MVKLFRTSFFFSRKAPTKNSCCIRDTSRTLWDFSTVGKLQKNWRGWILWCKKIEKSHSAKKNLKGGPLVSSGVVCYAGNLFGSVLWANGYNLASSQNFVELLVELFWSLQVFLKKTLAKSHDYSRLLSSEKRRLENQGHFCWKCQNSCRYNPVSFCNHLRISYSYTRFLKSKIEEHHKTKLYLSVLCFVFIRRISFKKKSLTITVISLKKSFSVR